VRTLFIIEEIPSSGIAIIDGDEGHHAATVLRIEVGEEILISDGRGNWAEAVVIERSKKSISCEITIKLTCIQALPKSDRVKETLELLTEAGVDQIIPWSASKSIAKWSDKASGLQKWQTQVREASKQARRFRIPEVIDLKSTNELKERCRDFDLILVFHESANISFTALISRLEVSAYKNIAVVIGPEGGISESEIEIFESVGGKLVKLGAPVFRSAHAGVAALAAIQTAFKMW
jgi:16S rRNA (uracil1498-N3)-methyltransferase